MSDMILLQEELEEVLEELSDLRDRIRKAEDQLTGSTGERLRQVRAQLESLMSKDHGWLGGSMYTLQGVIDEVEEEAQNGDIDADF